MKDLVGPTSSPSLSAATDRDAPGREGAAYHTGAGNIDIDIDGSTPRELEELLNFQSLALAHRSLSIAFSLSRY